MKKLIAFDLDGTLAPSKSPTPELIAKLLNKLLDKFQICIISGGNFNQFQKQLLSNKYLDQFKFSKLHLMPTCGTRYFIFDIKTKEWQKVYAEDFNLTEKRVIIEALMKGIDILKFREAKTYGELIEDRESQITLSILGQDIVDILGDKGVKIKEEWDPTNKKKEALRSVIAPLIPQFEVKVGGLTSVDVTRPGIDKAYGINKLMKYLKLSKNDILFVGDRLQPGGNDYPVKAFGIDSLEISSWQETVVAIQAILHVI